jgi:hypothetical protein
MKMMDDGIDPNDLVGNESSLLTPLPVVLLTSFFFFLSLSVYDFHGECDLVLVDNPDFNNGQGLTIHIRTKIQRWWSYISSAVIQIGGDTLEVKSGIQDRQYWVNGVEGRYMILSGQLDSTIGGFSGRFRVKSDHVVQYKLFLPDDQTILIRSVKDMIRVELNGCNEEYFGNSLGLMGTYGKGEFLARNRTTIFQDENEFGQEWQVIPGSDPQLFREADGPQFPQRCRMPSDESISSIRRRLASSINRVDAEEACSHVMDRADEFSNCVYDVMATGDMEMADGY